MIGDAKARGKVKSTTSDRPVFAEKRSRLGGVKTIAGSTGKDDTEGGGDHEQAATARRMVKGMKNGPGLPNGTGPKPFEKKMGSGRNSGHKLIDSKDEGSDSGQAIDEWCRGKRSSYK